MSGVRFPHGVWLHFVIEPLNSAIDQPLYLQIMRRTMSSSEEDDRREFLEACGRFASVTPPAITVLLSTSLTSSAIASSDGRRRVSLITTAENRRPREEPSEAAQVSGVTAPT